MKKTILAMSMLLSFSVASEWRHMEQIDLMSDEDKSMVIGLSEQNDKHAVGIRCNGVDDFYIALFFEDHLGDKNKSINLRFDKGEVLELKAGPGSGGSSRVLLEADEHAILKKMSESHKMVARAFDYNGSSKTFSVSLSGFSDKAEKLSCLKPKS